MAALTLGIYDIEVNLSLGPDDTPQDHITSNLLKHCPYCGQADCRFSCDGSQGAQSDEEGETEEEAIWRFQYNAAISVIHTMILDHAFAGIDIQSKAYKSGIEGAVEQAKDEYYRPRID